MSPLRGRTFSRASRTAFAAVAASASSFVTVRARLRSSGSSSAADREGVGQDRVGGQGEGGNRRCELDEIEKHALDGVG
jgi:hypothetical protein